MRKANITKDDIEIIYARLKGIYNDEFHKKIEFWIKDGIIIKQL